MMAQGRNIGASRRKWRDDKGEDESADKGWDDTSLRDLCY